MSRRVVIRANAASPFLVSAAGANADTSDFGSLIFNGNQPPLRLWGTGFISVPTLEPFNVSQGWCVASPPIVATPAGTYPLFMIAGRSSQVSGAPSFLTTPVHQGGGFGGLLSGGVFWGVNFTHDTTSPRVFSDALINYCIFKNYG